MSRDCKATSTSKTGMVTLLRFVNDWFRHNLQIWQHRQIPAGRTINICPAPWQQLAG
jgi:hypothetical protein